MVAEKKSLENIVNKNDEDLMKMIEYISNPFGNFNAKSTFKTFSMEASRGKTSGTCQTIIDDIKKHGSIGKRIVFVSKFKKECIDFVTRINKETNESFAIAYIPSATEEGKSNNVTTNFKVCLTKKIIALTHSMYLRLCIANTLEYVVMKEDLENNFNLLIIDEQIDNVNSTYSTFSINEYNQVLNIFKSHEEIKKTYKKICEPLIDLIDNNSTDDALTHRAKYTDKFDNIDFSIEKECEAINSFIENNISDEFLEDYKIDNNYITTKNDLKKFIDGIALFYNEIENNNVLINSEYSTIYTYCSEFEFLMLKRNIWLDASAKFNSMYKLNEKFFDVVDSERIIDHSNCNFYYHRENTSKSSKQRNDITKFRDEKMKYILKHTKRNSKVLILTSKTECIQIKRNHIDKELEDKIEEIKFYNFDNMRGINDCGDFNYCYILQTPRKQIPYYIFLYEYWKSEKLTDDEMKTNKINGNEDWGFINNKELQQLMIDDIASSLYQGCKRIARSSEPIGYFHIFCRIDKSVLITLKQLYNIKPNKDGKLTDYDNSKRKKNSAKGKIINWLKKFDGEFRLNDILKKFKVTKSNWDYINRDSEVKKIKDERNIVCKRVKGKGKDYYLYIES